MRHVKIPTERIGVLIGEGGETLEAIEEAGEVELEVDSENGAVRLESVGDSLKGMTAAEVVEAIGRGFAPAEAMTLFDEEMRMFELIDIERVARNDNDLRRQKGRLIGEGGRTRELMEELTGANVVIYGSTLGIIGSPREIEIVRSAADMLLDGAPHGAVYSFLERKRVEELKSRGLEYHEFS